MAIGKSKAGRDELASLVQQTLSLDSKKEAEHIIATVVSALEKTLLNNLANDKFSLKLSSFGKFTVRHRPGTVRTIPFTGETKMTSARRKIKFVTLGELRKKEKVTPPTS
jgi:nucleoid DNA-binding protein